MTRPTVVALSIPADPERPVSVVNVPATLSGVRQHVGRVGDEPHLETIRLALFGWTFLWLDEDGRAKGLEPNPRASVLGATTGLLGADQIVGDVLVLGSTPEGDDVSLTVDALGRLARVLGLEGMVV